MDRRELLKFCYKYAMLSAAVCLIPRPLLAALRPAPKRPSSSKHLSFYNLHTGESLNITYAVGGRYIQDALQAINHIFRDFRTDEVKAIDPTLLDLLHSISKTMELKEKHSLHIVSGYRSPQTNAMLRKRSRGVAKNSYHIKGQAVDFHVPSFSLSQLRKAALYLQTGGVGYYPQHNFLHIDVGEFRCW